jgi:hypothetical protein
MSPGKEVYEVAHFLEDGSPLDDEPDGRLVIRATGIKIRRIRRVVKPRREHPKKPPRKLRERLAS